MAISYKTTTSEKKLGNRTYSTVSSVRTDDSDGSTIHVNLSGYIDTPKEKTRFKDDLVIAFKEKKAAKEANDTIVDGLGDKVSAFMMTKEPI